MHICWLNIRWMMVGESGKGGGFCPGRISSTQNSACNKLDHYFFLNVREKNAKMCHGIPNKHSAAVHNSRIQKQILFSQRKSRKSAPHGIEIP